MPSAGAPHSYLLETMVASVATFLPLHHTRKIMATIRSTFGLQHSIGNRPPAGSTITVGGTGGPQVSYASLSTCKTATCVTMTAATPSTPASSYRTALLAVILGQIRSHHSPNALVKRSRRTQSREVISFRHSDQTEIKC